MTATAPYLGRRALLAGSALLAAGAAHAQAQAQAQPWPSRPLRMIVPFPPGGTTDLLARLLTDGLANRLGQPVVAENRGGAGGAVGAELASRMDPDGYNLFFGTIGSAAIIPHLHARLNYKPEDLAPVALFADLPNVFVVSKRSRWQTLQDFLAEARQKPGQLTFASSGIGSSLHLSGELLRHTGKVDILHVPFRGGSDTGNEVLSGRIDLGVNNLPSAIGLIRGGELRALAVTSPQRAEVLPDVPTVAECGLAGFDATAWFGLQVPARTPVEIINRLNAETNAVLNDPTIRARIIQVGARARGGSIGDFADYIRAENVKWAEVIRQSGAKVE